MITVFLKNLINNPMFLQAVMRSPFLLHKNAITDLLVGLPKKKAIFGRKPYDPLKTFCRGELRSPLILR
jgi:hypothetical protein